MCHFNQVVFGNRYSSEILETVSYQDFMDKDLAENSFREYQGIVNPANNDHPWDQIAVVDKRSLFKIQ
jgi:hypothetical protein